MNEGRIKCSKCDEIIQRGIYTSTEQYLCHGCYVAGLKPTINLVELHDSDEIINPFNRLPITIGKDGLYDCGFRLIKQREYVGSGKKYPFKKVMTLRYLGSKRCSLINGFRWPRGIIGCVKSCEV